jgi:hypothetical protein
MAYLPQFEEDIFVSYAHVDDEAVSGSGQGWVTEFVKCLKAELARKLGRSDAYALWVDHDLRHSQPVTPQILERVRRSAMLVLIMSPGYIASDWCRQEREAFLEAARGRDAQNVFVVEVDHIDDLDRPADLADLSPIRFWTTTPKGGAPRLFGWPRPQPDDYEFYGAVKDLTQSIVDEMRRLRKAQPIIANPALTTAAQLRSAVAEPPTPPTGTNGTIYLAQVTDDLETERNNVRRFLEQAGIRVLPTGWYSLEPSNFRRAAGADIADADLFVQLLSSVAGKRPPDLPEGYVQCQLQLALDVGKPVLQWYSPLLDIHSVDDDAHRALLQRPTVSAEPIEDFKQAIRRRLTEIRSPALPHPHTNAFIFVDMDSSDRLLAESLCDILDRYGAGYMLPLDTEDPGDYRRDLEDNLSQCDALMVIYGATTANWVRSHLRECHKALISRAQPPRGLALLQGPPGPKDRLPVRLPNMKVLDCQNGVDEAAIAGFLESLRERAT